MLSCKYTMIIIVCDVCDKNCHILESEGFPENWKEVKFVQIIDDDGPTVLYTRWHSCENCELTIPDDAFDIKWSHKND